MSFDHDLHHSKAWYKFVSETAIKDAEVMQHVAAYMDAQAKLNERLVVLAEAHPDLNLTVRRISEGHTISDGMIRQIGTYADIHDIETSASALDPVTSRSADRTDVCRKSRGAPSAPGLVSGLAFRSPNRPDKGRNLTYRPSCCECGLQSLISKNRASPCIFVMTSQPRVITIRVQP